MLTENTYVLQSKNQKMKISWTPIIKIYPATHWCDDWLPTIKKL